MSYGVGASTLHDGRAATRNTTTKRPFRFNRSICVAGVRIKDCDEMTLNDADGIRYLIADHNHRTIGSSLIGEHTCCVVPFEATFDACRTPWPHDQDEYTPMIHNNMTKCIHTRCAPGWRGWSVPAATWGEANGFEKKKASGNKTSESISCADGQAAGPERHPAGLSGESNVNGHANHMCHVLGGAR